jgi:hypothetical protein
MTLNVNGSITTSDVQSSGYCSVRGSATLAGLGSLVLSNIVTPGLLVGTVYETNGSYYTADVVSIAGLPATVARFAPASGNIVTFTVSGSNVTISNTNVSSRVLYWNFTVFST